MHKKALKKERIKSRDQVWVFVTFCASLWLNKSVKIIMDLEHVGQFDTLGPYRNHRSRRHMTIDFAALIYAYPPRLDK
jgi:hypothetical protein